jgi:photosystem II stability/assembly factor-like uncharacterized protein
MGARAQALEGSVPIRGFDLLDAQLGWLWRGDDLHWSEDGGATWRQITPGNGTAALAAVHFANPGAGWALIAPAPNPAQAVASILLARTTDSGETWQFAALPQELAGALVAAKSLYVIPLDASRGWIAAALPTSSNFSRGALWYTADGGVTWQQRELPLGEAPYFVDEEEGWLAGGPRGDELWRTSDGGATWQQQALPRTPHAGEQLRVYTPLVTQDGAARLLPILVRNGSGQEVEFWAAEGENWSLIKRTPGDQGLAGVAEADARAFLVARYGAIQPPVAPLPFFANTHLSDDLAGDLAGYNLVQVKMAAALEGWGLATDAAHAERLLTTHDGGMNWQLLDLPPVTTQTLVDGAKPSSAAEPTAGTPAVATVERTSIGRGPGFDICNLPSPAELSTWWSASPYRIVNLYIGGVLRFCDNQNLSAAALSQLSTQGWKFIPTWVGPQAPCTNYRSRFSSSPGDAFNQGRAEADAALDAARALGLAEAGGAGTIIYYDMESFDPLDEGCIAAAQAFVAGWTSRLHERGSQAGLYGSACSPRIEGYATIAAPPDAVWVAQWNRDFFDPNMTVWGIFCLDDSLWARSQRIRQYTGGHDETWGGLTLNIDSNVVDSIVADLSGNPPTPTPTRTPTPTPQPAVVAEAPELDPPYSGGMCGAGWHLYMNERNYPAFLAANRSANGTIPPLVATWEPKAPADGFYRVEAYIPRHDPVQWSCPSALLSADTASANYIVRHAGGITSKVISQAKVKGGWLLLGIYPFRTSLDAQVTLNTTTGERANTRSVSASALRLTRVDRWPPGSEFIYLPQIDRR